MKCEKFEVEELINSYGTFYGYRVNATGESIHDAIYDIAVMFSLDIDDAYQWASEGDIWHQLHIDFCRIESEQPA